MRAQEGARHLNRVNFLSFSEESELAELLFFIEAVSALCLYRCRSVQQHTVESGHQAIVQLHIGSASRGFHGAQDTAAPASAISRYVAPRALMTYSLILDPAKIG